MLKMYHKNPHSGNTPDYWANSWDEIDFDDALKVCSVDPLQKVFDKYVNKDDLFLEGGCGKGHWVANFADKNYRIIGLDFSQRTLSELQHNRQGLSLCCGNVNALPFEENTFDAYYSGGVVEHFEGGCSVSLEEARRVLKHSGTLLMSVPYYSPLRRILTPFRKKEWRQLSKPEVDQRAISPELTYFQYAYHVKEFKKMLGEAGLDTIETLGYSVIWGLYDLRSLNRRANIKKSRATRIDTTPEQLSPQSGALSDDHALKSYLKKLLVSEDTSTSLNRMSTRFMRWSCANMMMFVCRKSR